ncbi:hypothetical protein JRC19_29750, partial [Escherichia coli]|nr:hypothetical protein [Escherichia coli]
KPRAVILPDKDPLSGDDMAGTVYRAETRGGDGERATPRALSRMGVQPVVNAVHEADHLPRTFTHLRLLAVHGDPVGTAVVKPGQR